MADNDNGDRANGRVVRQASAVSAGDTLRLRLWKGALNCRVDQVEEGVD